MLDANSLQSLVEPLGFHIILQNGVVEIDGAQVTIDSYNPFCLTCKAYIRSTDLHKDLLNKDGNYEPLRPE